MRESWLLPLLLQEAGLLLLNGGCTLSSPFGVVLRCMERSLFPSPCSCFCLFTRGGGELHLLLSSLLSEIVMYSRTMAAEEPNSDLLVGHLVPLTNALPLGECKSLLAV